jgi:hypothetical protein
MIKCKLESVSVSEVRDYITSHQPKRVSAWGRGVLAEAMDMLDRAEGRGDTLPTTRVRQYLLDGAESASQYASGGCSLVCDSDIAERYCTPSELRRTRGGELWPSPSESWMDVEARGVESAMGVIAHAVIRVVIESTR